MISKKEADVLRAWARADTTGFGPHFDAAIAVAKRLAKTPPVDTVQKSAEDAIGAELDAAVRIYRFAQSELDELYRQLPQTLPDDRFPTTSSLLHNVLMVWVDHLLENGALKLSQERTLIDRLTDTLAEIEAIRSVREDHD